MQSRAIGNEYRTTLVCVDTYDQQVMAGRIYNPFCAGLHFHSTIDFLEQMEELLNEMGCPQPFMSGRRFSGPPGRTPAPHGEEYLPEGECATFTVRVIFRQNASWQGSLTWLEGEKEANFRSVLELLRLMDSVLSENALKPKSVSIG